MSAVDNHSKQEFTVGVSDTQQPSFYVPKPADPAAAPPESSPEEAVQQPWESTTPAGTGTEPLQVLPLYEPANDTVSRDFVAGQIASGVAELYLDFQSGRMTAEDYSRSFERSLDLYEKLYPGVETATVRSQFNAEIERALRSLR